MVLFLPAACVGLVDVSVLFFEVDVAVDVDVDVDVLLSFLLSDPQPTSAKLNETAARPAVATAVIFLFIERVLLFLLWRAVLSDQPNSIEQLSALHSEST